MQLNESDPKYLEATQLFLSGDWASAEPAFAELAESYPDSELVFLMRGNIAYSRGKLDEAVSHYQRAIKIRPDFSNAYYKLGVCNYRLGKLQRALDSFRRVVELKNQGHAMAAYFIGLINVFLGNDEQASEGFSQFRENSPESLIANFYLAQLKMKQQAYAEALVLLNELVEENPHFAEVHYMLGTVHFGLHNNAEAVKHFRRAIEINPKDQRSRSKLTLLTEVQW